MLVLLSRAVTTDSLVSRRAPPLRYPTNGTAHSAARRDKYLMGEAVRGAGLRAVRQVEVNDWAAAAPFVAEVNE